MKPVIEVRNVTKYHGRELVLDDVSVEVHEGCQLALLGPGGAGKSLLLKIMCGLVRPDSGDVRVMGHEILRMNDVELASVRMNIGMLFQNYALFDFMTVEENIGFPLRQQRVPEPEIAGRVSELLTAVDLPRAHHLFPNELSGGMKKRVTFARAVISNPPIVFYDDPTAGLDPVTSSKIFILLERRWRAGGTTSVVITHDVLGVRDICDEFIVLNHGRKAFQGTRAEIERCDDRLVRQFWEGTSDE